ncbi:maleylpyruvate isomerase family mycothiol-dependent enzyme [Nocardioides zhouii]|uniref:Maleylpyruvate isomerase family mycothiol-dependent enzyme n=1 Tax=Nocardioides zhouii TaxID=1168729 RepID=A0A4V1RNT9_9ACTN|nr:maleylpyruvate isomerase family mycothiol-dependent enzyme [Nocardioides zhouii]RYC07017.1 maleylpyruvate isomerase family mycothiol-dependent enzyme [Nocardioides zhouii]
MTTPLTDLVRRERRGFLDTLGSLSTEQWDEQSLCSGWRVIDVAAHLAWAPVLGPAAGAVAMLRNRLSVNRMIAATAVGWSERGRTRIMDQLERNLESGAKPIGMPTVAALADAVVHGIDVRRPLGLTHPIPADALGPVGEFVLQTPWPLNGVVGGNAARRIEGVRLVARDVEWSRGEGPEVTASAEAIARLLYGRPVTPDELAGPGAKVLGFRL